MHDATSGATPDDIRVCHVRCALLAALLVLVRISAVLCSLLDAGAREAETRHRDTEARAAYTLVCTLVSSLALALWLLWLWLCRDAAR